MLPTKGSLIVFLVLALSFTWGYKKDEIKNLLSGSGTVVTPAAPVPGSVPELEGAPPPPQPQAPQTAAPAGPPRQPSIQMPVNPAQGGQMPAPSFPPMGAAEPPPGPPVEYTQPANPYEDLSRKLQSQQNNLNSTFDSIRRSQVDEQQAVQKNAYFQKLSEQLKELQGQPPPSPNPAGDPAAQGGQPPAPPPIPFASPPGFPPGANAAVPPPIPSDPGDPNSEPQTAAFGVPFAEVDHGGSNDSAAEVGGAIDLNQPDAPAPDVDEPTEQDLDEENL